MDRVLVQYEIPFLVSVALYSSKEILPSPSVSAILIALSISSFVRFRSEKLSITSFISSCVIKPSPSLSQTSKSKPSSSLLESSPLFVIFIQNHYQYMYRTYTGHNNPRLVQFLHILHIYLESLSIYALVHCMYVFFIS